MCRKIGRVSGLKCKSLNLNFNILQKMINLNLIEMNGNCGLFIEERKDDFILNTVKNRLVYESYTFSKNNQSYEFINSIANEYEDIYYYGISGDLLHKDLVHEARLKLLNLNKNISIRGCSDRDSIDVSKIINSIGMVI